jgi:hypothetical protein
MIGMGEAAIIGLICCFVGGGAIAITGIAFFALRKKDERSEGER